MNKLPDNNAKDFTRHPELFECFMERMQRAHIAAEAYLGRTNPLVHAGLIKQQGFLTPQECTILAAEIMRTGAGDAKRPDSLAISAGGVTPKLVEKVIAFIQQQFKARQEEVAQEIWRTAYRQHLVMRGDDNDVQRVLHCDTFFPALKFWYFPCPVLVGAFTYAIGSAQLTPGRMEWHRVQVERIRTNCVEAWRTYGHAQGSFRINRQELLALGCRAAPVIVPGDTLVLANVFGFHCRETVLQEVHRLSISGSIRFSNPFLTQ